MQFHVSLPIHIFVRDCRQGNQDSTAETIHEIEEMGYSGVSCAHHISDPGLSALGHAGGEEVNWRYTDPLGLLCYLAAISKKVKLIPWVIVVPYRQPVELAHGLATIDALSGGRLVFGAGTGSQPSEFELLGVNRKERGKITDEWLDIVIELWTSRKATFSGRYHSFQNVDMAVRPVQQPRPPIWIGGGSRAAANRAVRVGDAWAPTCYGFPRTDPSARGALTAAELREELAWANDQRKSLGRPPLGCVVSNGVPLRFTARPEHGPGYSRSKVGHFTSVGTVEETTEEFAAFREAGAQDFLIKFTGDTTEAYLRDAEIFMNKVVPNLS